jgi:hypothetical protein
MQQQQQQQQQQQLNEQPMAMLNTPILLTNNTTTTVATTGETSPMTTIKKQGRFRVVKGITNDTSIVFPLSSENANTNSSNNNTSAAVGDDRNAIMNNSNDAIAVNPEISPRSSQPVSTIKKGRFLVKKATNNVANTTVVAAAHSGESDVELSPETVISFTTGEAIVDAANGGIDSSTLTPDVISNTNNKPTGAAKQKGRFLVKTGVESVPVAAAAAVGGGGTEVSSTDVLQAKATEAVDTKMNENVLASSIGDVKKKGRFVVKTGGGTGISVSTEAAAVAATNNVLSPMAPASGVAHQSNVANVQAASSNQQDSNPHPAAEVVPVQNTGVDASVQTMTTMASTLTAIPATTTQNAMQQQKHQRTDSQTSILQVPSATSSIGSSSSAGYNQQQQQQHQNLPQAPINANDAYLQPPPVAHRRTLTDAIAGPPMKANGTVVGGTSLAATGGGWMGGKSNGRMIGGGGVGKVLHYIDTMRTEVVEADRSIAALQSDNRHLRDKNKELEAKNKDLERKLMEEKRLRQKVEDKYTSLLQQDIGAHQEMISVPPPPPLAPGDDRRYSAPTLPPFDKTYSNTSQITEEFPLDNQKRHDRIASNTSAITEEFPSDVVIDEQNQQPNPIIIPLSRSNSFNAPPVMSPVMSIMKSSSTIDRTTTTAKSKANCFDPLGVVGINTSESRDHGGVTQNNTASSNSAASDAPPQLNNTTVDRTTKKHFDPLGTPESRATINSNDGLPPPLLLDGGLSQTSPTKCEDDPFDEIVRRVPHNHLQDYD